MNAEITKWRLLPLPRWTVVVVLAGVVLTGALLELFPPGDSTGFINVMNIVASLLVETAAIVLGAWAATLEFASGTLQRTLTAQADRNRVLLAKLGVLLLGVALLGLAAAAAGGGLVDAATAQQGIDLDRSDLARSLLANIPGPLAAGTIAFGIGLLTRSFGAALTASILFVYVLTGIFNFLPSVNRYIYTSFEADLSNRLAGAAPAEGTDMYSIPVALLGMLAWVVVLLVPGWLRFRRDDLK